MTDSCPHDIPYNYPCDVCDVDERIVLELFRQTRELVAQTLAHPGKAIRVPVLIESEGRKFMRGEPSLFDRLTLAQLNEIGKQK